MELISNYDLSKDSSVEEIVASLFRNGVTRIREFWPKTIMTKLTQEFYSLMANDSDISGQKVIDYYRPNTRSKAVELRRHQLDSSIFPNLFYIFSSQFVSSVTFGYLGKKSSVIDGIYLTYDFPHSTPVTKVHFDRIHALKFLIYLKDTKIENGALAIIPNSREEGYKLRVKHILNGVPLAKIPIIQPDILIDKMVSLDGKAGTMIIFDTDLFHMGGKVEVGFERCIVRGHSHPIDNTKCVWHDCL